MAGPWSAQITRASDARDSDAVGQALLPASPKVPDVSKSVQAGKSEDTAWESHRGKTRHTGNSVETATRVGQWFRPGQLADGRVYRHCGLGNWMRQCRVARHFPPSMASVPLDSPP